VVPSVVQVTGDAAEMDRPGAKAEEGIDSDDAEGAAMNMGHAALMAKLLAKTHHEDFEAIRLFQAVYALFRSQELSYRAMALFRMAGGQLPAFSVSVEASHSPTAASNRRFARSVTRTICRVHSLQMHPAPGGSH
jgi:hypothetical protein